VVADAGHTRMTVDDVQRRAHLAYKAYDVLSVTEPSRPDRPDVIVLEGHCGRIVRLFDPYTGADLGDPRSVLDRTVRWLADLHDNLLAGLTGRTLNGIVALGVVLLSRTGMMVWGAGVKNWLRGVDTGARVLCVRRTWD